MGWYISNGKAKCASCGKKIKKGQKLYFLDGDKQEHFICFWNRIDAEDKAKREQS